MPSSAMTREQRQVPTMQIGTGSALGTTALNASAATGLLIPRNAAMTAGQKEISAERSI